MQIMQNKENYLSKIKGSFTKSKIYFYKTQFQFSKIRFYKTLESNIFIYQLFSRSVAKQFFRQMNKILLPDFPGNNLLFHCVSHGNAVDALNLLQNKQAQINARNVNGCTPLHMAVMVQNMNLVKLLVKYGADINLKEYNDVGQKTPLHYAVQKNNFQITSFLLDNGANPGLGDKRQMTALHYAARFGFKQIVKLLMTNGADINVRDMNGFNAAHWAKMNQFNQIVEMIGPPRSIGPNDYQEYKKAMIQIHQINLKKKKKKGKKKK